jgi:hypothetical protein
MSDEELKELMRQLEEIYKQISKELNRRCIRDMFKKVGL